MDGISAERIKALLGEGGRHFRLRVLESTSSTNTLLASEAAELPHFSVVAAGAQTQGRGRLGRSFFSPPDTGVYISILLKENITCTDAGRLTTAAAIAACRAIEKCTDAKPAIKWVNDVFVGGRKVCGILTEASINCDTGQPDHMIVGIGFNVYPPEGGFPPELKEIAGSIVTERREGLRSALAAAFLNAFWEIFQTPGDPALFSEYKERCFVLGREIYVIKRNGPIPAKALKLMDDYSLLVRYQDGKKEVINAGEISIRPVESRL